MNSKKRRKSKSRVVSPLRRASKEWRLIEAAEAQVAAALAGAVRSLLYTSWVRGFG